MLPIPFPQIISCDVTLRVAKWPQRLTNCLLKKHDCPWKNPHPPCPPPTVKTSLFNKRHPGPRNSFWPLLALLAERFKIHSAPFVCSNLSILTASLTFWVCFSFLEGPLFWRLCFVVDSRFRVWCFDCWHSWGIISSEIPPFLLKCFIPHKGPKIEHCYYKYCCFCCVQPPSPK